MRRNTQMYPSAIANTSLAKMGKNTRGCEAARRCPKVRLVDSSQYGSIKFQVHSVENTLVSIKARVSSSGQTTKIFFKGGNAFNRVVNGERGPNRAK